MIELYHGSNVTIEKINLKRGRKGKDFGQGFYLSVDRQQALTMAQITVDREGTGRVALNTYLFDEAYMKDPSLNVLLFDGYSNEWAKFITMNRSNRTEKQAHNYDIVFGPIADDKVGVQVQLFRDELITIDELVYKLKFARPTFQYFFGTERAISLLTPTNQSLL